jgi:hypothetical protein
MSKKSTPDNQFQQFIKKFHQFFGIQREEDVQTQEHKLLASSVQLDALIVFPLTFDFTKLRDRVFPFFNCKSFSSAKRKK